MLLNVPFGWFVASYSQQSHRTACSFQNQDRAPDRAWLRALRMRYGVRKAQPHRELDCGLNITLTLDGYVSLDPTPCLNAFWHAVPTSLYIFNIFITLFGW